MRTFVSFLSGAAAVGLVVGLLALGGVIDNDTTTSSSSPPSPIVSTPSGQGNVSTKPGTVADIYKRVSPGVVYVSSSGGGSGGSNLFGGQQETAASGSGFVFDNQGHIVT